MTGAGRWVVSWECHISASALASAPAPAPGTPIVCQSRTPTPTPTPRVGCASGLRHRQTQTSADTDTDSELLSLRARWLLFAQRAHPGSSVGRHSYSNCQFRALGYTGVVTNAPTLTFTYTYALFVDTNVWNSHCDGAYPQPQWDCACSAYNSSSQVTSRLRRSVNQYALNSGSATPSEGIQLSPVFG